MAQTRKPALRAADSHTPVYQLRVELLYLKPAVWRQVLVPGSIKLPKLHRVFQWSMGWDDEHLHEFVFDGTCYGIPDPDSPFPSDPPVRNEARVPLTQALGALKSFNYSYDFGDMWEHRVKIEKILPPDPELRLPLCLAGRNACPPEDVGGPPGYFAFLEAVNDPSHEDHEQMLEWWGGEFDPKAFDLDAVNRQLSQIKL
jgi:hypothetical protein